MANRGAQTPTPQMVSPPGDLFIRRDDSIYGLRGLILASGRSQNHQEDTSDEPFFSLESKYTSPLVGFSNLKLKPSSAQLT